MLVDEANLSSSHCALTREIRLLAGMRQMKYGEQEKEKESDS